MNLDSTTLIMASLTVAAVACGAGPSAPEGAGGASTGASVVTVGSGTTTGVDPGYMPHPSPKEFFVTRVYQSLRKDCGGCHAEGQVEGPIFLLDTADAAYDFLHIYNDGALVAVPEKNLLLLKDQHEGPDIGGTTRANVAQWLELEYPGRPDMAAPKSMFQALLNFGQCLSKQAFLDSELDQLFSLPTDAVAGAACTCATCHNKSDAAAVGGSLILDPDADLTFAGLQSFPGMMVFAQGQVGETGAFQALTASHRLALKGQELNVKGPDETECLCDPDHRLDPAQDFGAYCHPTYTLDPIFVERIDTYTENAITRENMLQCNPDNTK